MKKISILQVFLLCLMFLNFTSQKNLRNLETVIEQGVDVQIITNHEFLTSAIQTTNEIQYFKITPTEIQSHMIFHMYPCFKGTFYIQFNENLSDLIGGKKEYKAIVNHSYDHYMAKQNLQTNNPIYVSIQEMTGKVGEFKTIVEYYNIDSFSPYEYIQLESPKISTQKHQSGANTYLAFGIDSPKYSKRNQNNRSFIADEVYYNLIVGSNSNEVYQELHCNLPEHIQNRRILATQQGSLMHKELKRQEIPQSSQKIVLELLLSEIEKFFHDHAVELFFGVQVTMIGQNTDFDKKQQVNMVYEETSFTINQLKLLKSENQQQAVNNHPQQPQKQEIPTFDRNQNFTICIVILLVFVLGYKIRQFNQTQDLTEQKYKEQNDKSSVIDQNVISVNLGTNNNI